MVEGLVIGAGIVLGLAFAFFLKPKMKSPEMSPATLDSFNVTTASEGAVVPEVFGRVRLPGNIIWYGNLKSVAIEEEAGGKGGGSSTQTVGYAYYLDIWQALCMGKVSIIKTYVDNKERSLELGDDILIGVAAGGTDFNNGTGTSYPTAPGEYANKIPGVAHMFWDQMYLGENRTFVPTVHFVVERQYTPSNINHPSLSNGHNPAAIIYKVLVDAGHPVNMINITMFNEAADYWYSRGYGLNISFSRLKKVREKIAMVLFYVGGAFGEDNDGKLYIKAFDPDDTTVATINTKDFISFGLRRRTWRDTSNVFVASYNDKAQDFSKRNLVTRNIANINIQGRVQTKSVDLTGFRDADTASKRLWEIMKDESYPGADIDFTTNLAFSSVLVGQVVTINHSDYGISNAEFRITERHISEIDKNEIKWVARQKTEKLFDSSWQSSGMSSWTIPDYSPAPFVHQALYELPYSNEFGHSPAILMLGARCGDVEIGWNVYVSSTGTDYALAGSFAGFAQYGELDEEYPAGTYTIDDDTGILFTPYRDDPKFGTISRTELFSKMRYALIGSELLKFETVTPVGTSQYRLGGIMRGVAGTTPAAHSAGSGIWLCSKSNNVLTGIAGSHVYVKLVPFNMSEGVNIADATAMEITLTGLARKPWPVSRIKAVRSGASVQVSWWPANQDNPGAGTAAEDMQTDTQPFLYDGDFETYETNTGTIHVVDGISYTYSQALALTVYVRARRNGYVGEWKSLAVPAGDGTYRGPDA